MGNIFAQVFVVLYSKQTDRKTKVTISPERLKEIASELASRPHHEKVRSLVYELLVNGLGARSTELDFERQVPEVHGRIDALLGRTLFEFKSDLRREQRDAENKLPDYLNQREKETGTHFIGVVTDWATFIPYELRGGKLCQFEVFNIPPDNPRELLLWLSSVVAVNADLEPTSEIVRRELGRSSLAWNVARHELGAIWNEVCKYPEIQLKHDLWAQLIRRVYGATLDEDSLFLQHTYLTVIAKTMAARVLGVSAAEPGELLSGRRFTEVGIGGVVESDFFDWMLESGKGVDLVRRIALQAGRFRLEDVQTDVLKGLYESLIDPDQRHFLGEYYTPDWLAERMCVEAINNPLEQRVLDPACGSGTFIFHAVRLLLKTADESGIPVPDAIERACRQIFGVDVHPVSVQIARVTFLLAVGQDRLKQRPLNLNIPVYMGDSLQWNTRGFLAERDVLIEVPETNKLLEFPFEVTHGPVLFDAVIERMLELSQQGASSDSLTDWLERNYHLCEETLKTLAQTYDTLHELHRNKRDHIWGFVARNLVRPIWLSQNSQKADVVIGNPPWLSYRFMDADLQSRFRMECQSFGIWHGQVAQQQDLSAYFFVRSVELYLRDGGTIAFIMPYAAMTRRQFARFRTGLYGSPQKGSSRLVFATVHFTDAWVFSDKVQPLFPVPSCVLFAVSGDGGGPRLPERVHVAQGELPRRDASATEASKYLSWHIQSWPTERTSRVTEGYADRFRSGAIIIPRIFFTVQEIEVGKLGKNPAAPLVVSRRSNLEKPPWKNLPSLRHNIEASFLRPLYLGESIAPFRVLSPILSIIPWDNEQNKLLSSTEALLQGYVHLARWSAEAARIWSQYSSGRRTLIEQLDYYGQLSAQFPVAPLRVVYSASGTLPAAALLSDETAIIEHGLYWMKVGSKGEGHYLLSILNSETARKLTERLQARGQWGARHFDKVVLSLPIPPFDHSDKLHKALANASTRAERVAAAVPLDEGMHFVKARQKIRATLREDGIAQKIDELVSELLEIKR
ncbi:MAG: N-6 DNA methylase [Chloroflexi bacterium]|nr:N-6 DNA methylase [Chloroflexota bacterium]